MRTLLIVMLGTLILGCASQPENVQPQQGKGLAIAHNDALGSSLIPLKTESHVRFEKLDGVQLSSFTKNVEVLHIEPGAHVLETSCTIRNGAMNLKGAAIHNINIEAGKTYYFKAALTNGACGVELTEPN
jgi:hypothetical protein